MTSLVCMSAAGPWLNYPTPGVPRTPDGKPNLSAPVPRGADGKPDLSGLWEMEHNRPIPATGLGCEPVSLEFINIGSSIKEGLPYQAGVAEMVNAPGGPTPSAKLTHYPDFRLLFERLEVENLDFHGIEMVVQNRFD
jgi:hypothetical protein